MSIVLQLAKQRLIAQKNDAMFAMLQNSARQRNLLSDISFGSDLCALSNYETALSLENISNEAQLASINAELNALNNYQINYFA